jgi:hypothetical protein
MNTSKYFSFNFVFFFGPRYEVQSVCPMDRRFRVIAELRDLTMVEVMAELK